MRYFCELSYQGTAYAGWQKQPQAPSVQACIEKGFSTILRTEIAVTGCGRTDAGVHASQYFLHFDFEADLPPDLIHRLNGILPPDIAVRRIFPVRSEAHARYDAIKRSYAYHITTVKDPFSRDFAWHFPQYHVLNLEKMQEMAALLPEYEDFAPFCKTHSGAKTMKCHLLRSEWDFDLNHQRMTFRISANRFLRGMVRLIVGACINVGLGMISLSEIRQAMHQQVFLKKSFSVPPHGLFLNEVVYDEDIAL